MAANAKAIDQLKKMPVNPALQKIVTSASAGGTTTSAAAQDEHAFVAKAKEYAKAHNITDAIEAQAKFAGTAEGKDLYAQYRESLVAK